MGITPTVTEVTQLTVTLPNRAGTLFNLLTSLGTNVNVLGLSAETSGDASLVRLIVDKAYEINTVSLLQTKGFQVFTAPAYSVELSNTYGSLAGFIKNFGGAKINLSGIYATGMGSSSRVIFTVDNVVLFQQWLSSQSIKTAEPALA